MNYNNKPNNYLKRYADGISMIAIVAIVAIILTVIVNYPFDGDLTINVSGHNAIDPNHTDYAPTYLYDVLAYKKTSSGDYFICGAASPRGMTISSGCIIDSTIYLAVVPNANSSLYVAPEKILEMNTGITSYDLVDVVKDGTKWFVFKVDLHGKGVFSHEFKFNTYFYTARGSYP